MSDTRVDVNQGVLISAVRYALGRMTYITADTVDEVLRAWPSLTKNTRAVIVRDVRQALADDRVGWSMDRAEWNRLLTAAAVEAGER